MQKKEPTTREEMIDDAIQSMKTEVSSTVKRTMWAYYTLERYSEDGECNGRDWDGENLLNQMGTVGWELVSTTYVPLIPNDDLVRGKWVWNFKREIDDDPELRMEELQRSLI
jgi:hypothetical protein